MNNDRFTRVRMLFGDDFDILKTKKLLLCGVGGVGSYCLDALWRSGITNITIIDFDTYDITNQNRQIGSDIQGAIKVSRLGELYPGVTPIHARVDADFLADFDFAPYDLVLDAIDDVPAKILLIEHTYKKLISSMGGAKRTDPTKITYGSIWKTYNDPFARKIRDELKKRRFNRDFKVVSSTEPPQCIEKGSFVSVTGTFGLTMAAKAVEKLIRTHQ